MTEHLPAFTGPTSDSPEASAVNVKVTKSPHLPVTGRTV